MNGTTVKPTKRPVPGLELPTTDHPRICKTCPEPQPVEERELKDYLEIQARNLWPAPKSLHQRIMPPEIVIKKVCFHDLLQYHGVKDRGISWNFLFASVCRGHRPWRLGSVTATVPTCNQLMKSSSFTWVTCQSSAMFHSICSNSYNFSGYEFPGILGTTTSWKKTHQTQFCHIFWPCNSFSPSLISGYIWGFFPLHHPRYPRVSTPHLQVLSQ